MGMLVVEEPAHATPDAPETDIMPAFGRGMCPKLVAEVQSAKRAVRVNALEVLCDEFKNPASVVGCVDCGVVEVLNDQAAGDPDPLTRLRASAALAHCARDATGRRAMIAKNSAKAVKAALGDDENDVRGHVYEALIRVSSGSVAGVRSLIGANYAGLLVGKAAKEVVALQPPALELLTHCLYDPRGLESALSHGAVKTTITLLSSFDAKVREKAAACLAILCFAEEAKEAAIEGGAVPLLVDLMKDPDLASRSAAAAALAAVTMTDEGKRRMVPSPDAAEVESVALLLALLREGDGPLATNVLKVVANVAVHPKARNQLRNSADCLALLDGIIAGDNALNAKHAAIAKAAVLWEP